MNSTIQCVWFLTCAALWLLILQYILPQFLTEHPSRLLISTQIELEPDHAGLLYGCQQSPRGTTGPLGQWVGYSLHRLIDWLSWELDVLKSWKTLSCGDRDWKNQEVVSTEDQVGIMIYSWRQEWGWRGMAEHHSMVNQFVPAGTGVQPTCQCGNTGFLKKQIICGGFNYIQGVSQ